MLPTLSITEFLKNPRRFSWVKSTTTKTDEKIPEDEHLAVSKFRQYLRINTEQPAPNYKECQNFLYDYANELGLETFVYECVKGKPIIGMTMRGTDPSLPSILLYSHTDVVPSYKECWTHDPSSAFKDENGNIFARGTQDMKSNGIQYMEAIRELKTAKRTPLLRTVHVLWGPDEEIGSHEGMEMFIETKKFAELNIGFALDEGIASDTDEYRVFYGERCGWWMKFTVEGNPGHGSRLDIENTAGPKMTAFLNRLNEYREKQQQIRAAKNLRLGDLTSINLTKLDGGVQVNVLPTKLVAYVDMRISPDEDLQQIEKMLTGWCEEAGPGISIEFLHKYMCQTLTPHTREDLWWAAFDDVLKEQNCKYSTEIAVTGTDARLLRSKGYKALGFSPIVNTPIRLHDHDECLNERVFLRGVEIYTEVIERLANVPCH